MATVKSFSHLGISLKLNNVEPLTVVTAMTDNQTTDFKTATDTGYINRYFMNTEQKYWLLSLSADVEKHLKIYLKKESESG